MKYHIRAATQGICYGLFFMLSSASWASPQGPLPDVGAAKKAHREAPLPGFVIAPEELRSRVLSLPEKPIKKKYKRDDQSLCRDLMNTQSGRNLVFSVTGRRDCSTQGPGN